VACRRSVAPSSTPTLAEYPPAAKVENGVGVDTMPRMCLIEDDVHGRVAGPVSHLQLDPKILWSTA